MPAEGSHVVDSQRGEAAVKQDRDGAGPSGHVLDIGLKVDDERIIRRDRQGSQEEQVKHFQDFLALQKEAR